MITNYHINRMLLAPYIFYTTSSVPHRTFRGIPHTNFKNTAYVWTCSSQYTFGILYFFLHFIIFPSFIYHILNERLRITCGCGEKTCCENGGCFPPVKEVPNHSGLGDNNPTFNIHLMVKMNKTIYKTTIFKGF